LAITLYDINLKKYYLSIDTETFLVALVRTLIKFITNIKDGFWTLETSKKGVRIKYLSILSTIKIGISEIDCHDLIVTRTCKVVARIGIQTIMKVKFNTFLM
jgi:hypothetical protein